MEEERIARELAHKLEDKYDKVMDEQVAEAREAEKVQQVDTMLEIDITEEVKPLEDLAEPVEEITTEGTVLYIQ